MSAWFLNGQTTGIIKEAPVCILYCVINVYAPYNLQPKLEVYQETSNFQVTCFVTLEDDTQPKHV